MLPLDLLSGPMARRAACAVALAVAIAALWVRGSHYRDSRDEWRAAFAAQKAQVAAVQSAALEQARAARAATETRTAALARKADHDEEPARLGNAHAAAARFVADRRLRAQAACPASGPALAAAAPGAAPDRDRSGGYALAGPAMAGPILLTRAEYDLLAANTFRLERVRLWGEALIAEGLAVPEAQMPD